MDDATPTTSDPKKARFDFQGAPFVVMVGVLAVVAISIAAIITLAIVDQVGKDIATLATGAVGVIGTIVGADFWHEGRSRDWGCRQEGGAGRGPPRPVSGG